MKTTTPQYRQRTDRLLDTLQQLLGNIGARTLVEEQIDRLARIIYFAEQLSIDQGRSVAELTAEAAKSPEKPPEP